MNKVFDKKVINHIIEIVIERCDIHNNNSESYISVNENNREELVKDIQEALKLDESEICDECYALLSDEEYNNEFESRAGSGSNESVCFGYTCHECGHKEDF